ncbi:HET-domain-containing protein [Lojkania enalia]|uniref:HET-domain-containing protein n=1 Tax=Lojkania enalia TaxID=147567 RepID=A0A9P4KG02_9PLEO|nr:HET-domain-containing protein [Didymosphaeria enalia]
MDWIGQIQYLADDAEPEDRQFFGRYVDQASVNMSLIRHWLKTCAEVHGTSCEEPGKASRRLGRIRVIDVEHMVVVIAPLDCRYVALSYVWGGRQKFEARKELFRISPSGLEYLPLPKDLSQTILDACTVTRSIGERYLWVDSLCIVQNSDIDRHDQILRMDAVYSSAILTIAAGSGAHANTGLPGISTLRRFAQYRAQIDGIILAIPFPSLTTLEQGSNLIWNTRGWTLQEKVMSRRLLMFTDYQVYFRCSNMVWSEDVVLEKTRMSQNMQKKPQPLRWAADRTLTRKPPTMMQRLSYYFIRLFDSPPATESIPTQLLNYTSIVREYTQRTLSNPDDAVNAVLGILRTLKNTGPFYHGLPREFFDEALLWHILDCSSTCKALNILPSWTWAAWSTRKGCHWFLPDLRDTNINLYPKWILTDNGIEEIYRGRLWKGRIPSMPHLTFRSTNLLRSVGCFIYMKTAIHRLGFGKRIAERFTPVPNCDGLYHLYELVDKWDYCVGEIWMSRAVREAYKDRSADFIALSRGRSLIGATPASRYIPREDSSDTDENNYPPLPRKKWDIENVMLVAWTLVEGSCQIAERVAVGKVIYEASQNLDMEWVMLA